ncbi:MAG: phosphoribosyltransferase-like protein [Janthinobacterium lividum]
MTPSQIDTARTQYLQKIKVLSETVWEGKANGPFVQEWLTNFTGREVDLEEERVHMLYLLTQFMYYGRRETRALLEAVYYDLFRQPLIAQIRRQNGNTQDRSLIRTAFLQELSRTRFIGIGGPADSGSMLLYDLRKQLGLPDSVFATVDAVLAGKPEHCPPQVTRYVFIDDLCGSGDEATEFDATYVTPLRTRFGPDIEIDCFVLFATSKALQMLRPPATSFSRVEALHELDDSFHSLSTASRYFPR